MTGTSERDGSLRLSVGKEVLSTTQTKVWLVVKTIIMALKVLELTVAPDYIQGIALHRN